jgi:hypothetical protein
MMVWPVNLERWQFRAQLRESLINDWPEEALVNNVA